MSMFAERDWTMEKIVWHESFSVGVSKLAEQHKSIIKLINMLHRDPEATVNSETVSELLDRMTTYAGEHFNTEEQLLAEHEHPDLSAHKAKHRNYRKQVVALCMDTMNNQNSVPAEALQYLKQWWISHIQETDMKYRSFFEKRGIT